MSSDFLRPGQWTYRVPISTPDSTTVWTNMPAAAAFLFGTAGVCITLISLAGMYRVRLLVHKRGTAGAAGSKLIARYSPTFSTTASDYIDIGTSEVSVAIDTTNTFLNSGWVEINSTAMDYNDVYVAIIGTGGDGVIDPIFANMTMEFQ